MPDERNWPTSLPLVYSYLIIGSYTVEIPPPPPPEPVSTVTANVEASPFVKVITLLVAEAVVNNEPVSVDPPPLPVIEANEADTEPQSSIYTSEPVMDEVALIVVK